MEPLIARAFLTLLLSPDQVADLKAFENTLPPGRYLQGFEVVRRYALSAGSLEPEREAKMEELLRSWRGRNWKENQIENKHRGEGLEARTYQQEIHGWMDYVLKNWFEPLPMIRRRVSDVIEA